ncbi:MAG: dephospho-CoA kinase [Ruminococcaceae bacterium]|nr:dephospho-CoA kinase [Oscillospiraceae bacterium]
MKETGGTTVVGLTGQSGAGKSTLSRMFADHGYEVINADAVAREAMETSNLCLSDLVLEFSTEVIHPDATLNREKLAAICFGDKSKLRRLNEITFPYIIEAITHKLKDAEKRGVPFLVLDAPTLFESGLDKECDLVVAVIAREETRMARIISRDHMTEEAAARRIKAQNGDDFYSSRADEVLYNDEDVDALRLAFIELCERLEKGPPGRRETPDGTPGDTGEFGELNS